MHVLAVLVFLLLVFSVLKVSRGFVIQSKPYSTVQKTTVVASPSSNNVHNVTVYCGGYTNRKQIVLGCQWGLQHLTWYGYPWTPTDRQRNYRRNRNATDRNSTLRDALDSLNHVCQNYDRSQICLEERGIRDYCLFTTGYDNFQIQFQFICHHQRRDENLVHSLRCLYNTRVLAMLFFHIADRCRGTGILDDIMRRHKNAYFYAMGIRPGQEQTIVPPLFCLPKSVISTCIRGIVEDKCGSMTANLVTDFLVYIHNRFDKALESVALSSNICDHDISSDMMPSKPSIPSGHTKLGVSGLLEITAPGTALDTVWGKMLKAYLHRQSGEQLCTTDNSIVAYFTCVLSSDVKPERSKFNILQFAHRIVPIIYHGTQCSRLKEFTSCWNLLQEICGPKVRGFEQHATLLMEGCKIESEMDTIGCDWQDMLLPHYIQASRVTVWPMTVQCLGNPMSFDASDYNSTIMGDLDNLISLLQPGVEEISRKCGPQPAKRLRLLFNKLRYLQRDALKYTDLYFSSIPNYGN